MLSQLRKAGKRDWEIFLRLASREGWRVPLREARLLQGPWSSSVQVLAKDEIFCGMVSAVSHGACGWIGNLLVPPRLRGMGFGKCLFEAALKRLEEVDCQSIWLTASEQGAALYEGFGFKTVGTVERWVLPPHNRTSDVPVESGNRKKIADVDREVWGCERTEMMEVLSHSSSVVTVGEAVAVLQHDLDLEVLGPWYAPGSGAQENRLLLQRVLDIRNPRRELVVDALENRASRTLFLSMGFTPFGQNRLMRRGESLRVSLQKMVSLASLGSIG